MTKTELQQIVVDYAYGYGIDPQIALAQIQQESDFNPDAVGSSGERGLGQFMPGTWQRFGIGSFDNAFDPNYNLTAWGNYMSYLLNLFGWDYEKALIGYNGGEGHLLDPGRYGQPSQRARNYARSILANSGYVSINNSGNPDAENSILGLSFTTVLLIAGGIAAVIALQK